MGAEQEVERQRRQSGEQESLLRAELSKQQRLFEERANVQQRDWEGQLDVANQKNKNLQKELEVSKKDQQEKKQPEAPLQNCIDAKGAGGHDTRLASSPNAAVQEIGRLFFGPDRDKILDKLKGRLDVGAI